MTDGSTGKQRTFSVRVDRHTVLTQPCSGFIMQLSSQLDSSSCMHANVTPHLRH